MESVDDELPRETLDALEADAPPVGFADRVLAARAEELKRRSRRRAFGAGSIAVVLAAAATFALVTRAAPSQGELSARQRTTFDVGERATGVAEAGTSLAYRVESDGAARVEQQEGSVFYRVDRGDTPFEVITRAGTVRVLGTCFRVEVGEMGTSSRAGATGAVLGAAITAAVFVTVYEGRVVLANDHGETSVAAGEHASATTQDAPTPASAETPAQASASAPPAPSVDPALLADPSPTISREELTRQNAALRDAVRANEQRALALEGEVARLRGQVEPGGHNGNGNYFEPSQEELMHLVESCGVMLDMPPVLGTEPGEFEPDDSHVAEMGATEAEIAAINDAIRRVHTSFVAQLRAAYLDATGDHDGAAQLSPSSLLQELEDKGLEGEASRVRRTLAEERAGLRQPPGDLSALSPTERGMRVLAHVGDEMQSTLAQSVGPERAHALRAAQGGWPWSRMRSAGCDE